MTRTIGIFTGSRGEWGYLRPILQELKKNKIKFELIVTNMHLLSEKGFSYKEIEGDGFKITSKIFMNIDGPDQISWPKSLGLLAIQLPDLFDKLKIDILLLAGDRAETLTAANSAYYSDIPIAHIQAGELSGHKDGMARHAIGKLAHIHFASNVDASERLKRFGEQTFRIHNVGAPQLDDIRSQKPLSRNEINTHLKLKLKSTYAVCIVHPTSENIDECVKYIDWINKACLKLGFQQLWIYPNNDVGSKKIIDKIDISKQNDTITFRNLSRPVFLSILKNSCFIIGNSSAGILEAPSLKSTSINLGLRQKDRLRASSVIDIENVTEKRIVKAIKVSQLNKTRMLIKKIKNPYGDGKSTNRIVKILINIDLNNKLRNKLIQE